MQQKSDNVVSHYVFEAPVRIWHWLTVLCMAVLMVTGYFIRQAATFRQRRGDISVLYGLHQVNSLQRRDDFYRGFADADLLGFVGNRSPASCLSCRYGVKLVAGVV